MKLFNQFNWPVIAIFLVLSFISVDLFLISSTHAIRENLHSDNELIADLGAIESSMNELGQVHLEGDWDHSMGALRDRIELLNENNNSDEDLNELLPKLERVLNRADSLHKESLRSRDRIEAKQRTSAIISVVTARGGALVADASNNIRKVRLDGNINALSARWNNVQSLLLVACMFAMIMALVIGRNKRLIQQILLKQNELQASKQQLERTHKELRETMLSKEEKEVMIKEIHHRVKNNLQIVKSLIRFQMHTVSDEGINEKFNECVNRVSAMALVHEQTYLSKDLANIDVNGYLDQLTKDLIYAYNIDMPIDMDVDIQVPTLTVDTLVPLGLLLNEVISNTFKHAFKGRDAGTITVHIRGSEESGLDILMGDNGVGLPDRSQWSNHQSLGMDLIHTLTEQLDGAIELDDGPGTLYRLRTKGSDQHIQRRA